MKTVRVDCRTNIDCAKHLQWPSELPDRPLVGDTIRSVNSTNNKHIEMRVCHCIWVCRHVLITGQMIWVLEVWLDMIRPRFETPNDFEKFIKS